MKTLVVVDIQNDFVSGSLGSAEAQAIIEPVCDLIRSWKGNIIVTLDTHGCDYLETREGQMLPIPHCIKPTQGWQLNNYVAEALSMKPRVKYVEKNTFGSFSLYIDSEDNDEIVVVGLVTNICVINNALILRNLHPKKQISVIAECCAGTTPEDHQKALDIMKTNHINIL